MGATWKSAEVQQLALRQMDYMLGLNPWDISMIYGVGDKNWNHPHDRQANPEGRNLGDAYDYRVPVGAIAFWTEPKSNGNAGTVRWEDYMTSSYCLSTQATLLGATMMLADDSKIEVSATNPAGKLALHASKIKGRVEGTRLIVSIASTSNRTGLLKLVDLKGHVVQSKQVTLTPGHNQFELSLADLPAGIWIVGLDAGNSLKSFRFVL
jgi:hypothetical protein